MLSVALVPAVALIAGAVGAIFSDWPLNMCAWLLPVSCAAAGVAWRRRARAFTLLVLIGGFVIAGAVLGGAARERALHSSLRAFLAEAFGGFAIETLGPEGDHDPLPVRAVLTEDAADRQDFVSLRALVTAVFLRGQWRRVEGGVSLTVNGESATGRVDEWRAGRRIEAPVTFRRPARYLNEGVPDFEADLALDGTTLFGSIRSGLLVDVIGHGSVLQEAAADLRAHVRNAVGRRITPHDAVAGAIVTAVLIGDRTGLPDDIRDRLQAAGTYHVIAISGGNIAILAALALGILMCVAVHGRGAALVTIAVLLVYSQVATAGPSVWRATLMAVLYLGARLLDHRTAPWQATSLAAALMVVAAPLEVRDAGFILTFGATGALLEGARRGHALLPRHRLSAWLVASLTASLAAEVALLPVSAQAFSRVTTAGLVLNLLAVPMMGLAQLAGIAVTAFDSVDFVAAPAGWIGYAAAAALVESARLVDLTSRVPPPGIPLMVAYYVALFASIYGRGYRLRVAGALALGTCLVSIATGAPRRPSAPLQELHWTMFDVGQSEAMLVEVGGRALQIDSGGALFSTGSSYLGARVLAPALWARGIRALDALLITHGDPDHIGGAAVLLKDFSASELWEGIDVPRHAPSQAVRDAATAQGAKREARRAGEAFDWSGARIRVLHPPEPDWERPRIRNDDSVVLEIVYGDVALLLTGDAGADIERAIATQLTPAPIRILKVAHHGSRTSTSRELLETWRPQIALISAGRGNTFGHPAAEVLQRLESIGTQIFRTDLHGQITVQTNGRDVHVKTFVVTRTP
jgi:competence protein ComEC